MALKMITAPAEEPVSLDEVKTYLRIDGTDFDMLLAGLIRAAREYCENFQNRAFVTQTWELTLDDWPRFPLKLPKPPLQSVSSFIYTDKDGAATMWDESNYIVDSDSEPGRIVLAYNVSLPSVTLQPVNGIRIRFTAGYGTAAAVPENVKQAMMIFVASRFENPEKNDVPDVVHSLLWPERMVPV